MLDFKTAGIWTALACLTVVGCSSKDDGGASGTAVLDGPASAEVGPEAPATAKEAVEALMAGLGDKRTEVAWDALPASYQSDVNSLVQDFAGEMDGEVWTESTKLLNTLTAVLLEKKEFIFAHPMAQGMLSEKPEISENWDDGVGAIQTLVSAVSDLDDLKSFDGRKFLTGTGSQLVSQLEAISSAVPDEKVAAGLQSLRDTTVETVSEADGVVTLKVSRPGEEPEEKEFVQVEGKWVPKDFSENWPGMISDAQAKIAEVGPAIAESKEQAMQVIAMIGQTLKPFEEASDANAFNVAVGQAMMQVGPMMQMFGGGGGGPDDLPPGAFDDAGPSFGEPPADEQ